MKNGSQLLKIKILSQLKAQILYFLKMLCDFREGTSEIANWYLIDFSLIELKKNKLNFCLKKFNGSLNFE